MICGSKFWIISLKRYRLERNLTKLTAGTQMLKIQREFAVVFYWGILFCKKLIKEFGFFFEICQNLSHLHGTMVELDVLFCCLESALIEINMCWNFLGHLSVCLPFVHNNFILIYLLITVTALGVSWLYLVSGY